MKIWRNFNMDYKINLLLHSIIKLLMMHNNFKKIMNLLLKIMNMQHKQILNMQMRILDWQVAKNSFNNMNWHLKITISLQS